MIYKIFADGRLLYSSQYGATDRALIQPRMKLEMGKAGSLSFTILPSHYLYNEIHEMTTVVTVYCDDVELFRGRMLKFQDDFFKQRKVSCESNLAYLLDSVVYPFKQTMTVSDFVDSCLNDHNLQMEEWKRFTLGNVTIDEADTSVKFELSSNQQTSSVLESEVLNVYGGFLMTRYENGVQYLDYIKEYGIAGDRPIRFGWNMESLDRTTDGKDLYTKLMPIGKDDLTIAEVNNGSKFLPVSAEMVQRYGTIIKTHSFSSVSKAAELKQKALKYIQDNFKGERALGIDETFKIKALDMHMLDGSIDQIVIGCKAAIVSQPHGLDILKDCIAIEYNFDDPSQNVYEFGLPPETKEEKEKRSSSGGLGGGLASSLATAKEEAVETAEKKVYDAYIKADPDSGTVSLYGLYNQYEGDLVVLKNEVGIDLKAQPGSVIIYSRTTEGGASVDTHFGVLKGQIESKVSNGTFETYVQQTAEKLSALVAQTGVSPSLEVWKPDKEGGYHAGDQVVYDGVWYEFKVDYSGTTWDPTKVKQIDSQKTEITATSGQLTALVTEVGKSTDNTPTTLYGKFNLEAGRVEQIVSSVGNENGEVTAASIVLAINTQTSGEQESIAQIDADKILIGSNGNTKINLGNVLYVTQGGDLVVDGDWSRWDDLGTRQFTVGSASGGQGDEGVPADVMFIDGVFSCSSSTGFHASVAFNDELTCYVDPTKYMSTQPININSHSHKITITEETTGQYRGQMKVDLGEMTNTDSETQAYFKIADTITCQSLVAAAGAVSAAAWTAATQSEKSKFTVTTGGEHTAIGIVDISSTGWVSGHKTYTIVGKKSVDGSQDQTGTTIETLVADIPGITDQTVSAMYNPSGPQYSVSFEVGGRPLTCVISALDAYEDGQDSIVQRTVESLSPVTLASGDSPTALKTVTVSYTDQTSEDKSIRINSSSVFTAGQNSVNVSKGTWSNGSITFSPSAGTGSSRTLSVGVYADLGANAHTATVKAWDITNGVSSADETGASRNLYLRLSDGYAYITKSDSDPYNYHDSNVVAYATYPTYSVQYKTVEYTSNGNYTISPSSGYDAISSVDVRVYVQSSAPSVSCSNVSARIIEPPADYTTVSGPSASNCVTGNWIHFQVTVGSNTYGFKARIT